MTILQWVVLVILFSARKGPFVFLTVISRTFWGGALNAKKEFAFTFSFVRAVQITVRLYLDGKTGNDTWHPADPDQILRFSVVGLRTAQKNWSCLRSFLHCIQNSSTQHLLLKSFPFFKGSPDLLWIQTVWRTAPCDMYFLTISDQIVSRCTRSSAL